MELQALKQTLLQSGTIVDPKYLDCYFELIQAEGSVSKKPDMEKHHIIPKSYYKMFQLRVDNSSHNCVYLSRIQHIKAHYYLALAAQSWFRRNNVYAVVCLTRTSGWEEAITLLKDSAKLQEIQSLFQEHNANISQSRKGYKYSEEHNRNLSKALKATPLNKGPNNSMWGVHRISPTKNRLWFNNGEKRVMIKVEDIDSYISKGYRKGRGTW